ncbi:diphthamide biosynthesis enzyme Dph2 [Ferroplasma sp.]|uniref:diphthamide biosynthesis enzyme Dph2 n=1 Tax=Ferroplasma sp. TaxID=2591003 RepID=UPI0026193091|nr:diphthamide biosynthesis enzyme Dph2 [Ferroplasma sp.]MCL4452947.1 diphthamide biosynthesis enzyme Dph2 [Candidatus Thermoplasmatota archaeon]
MDVEGAIEELKNLKAEKILLQIPDGLKPESFNIFNRFSEQFKVIISSQSFYGACDIGNMEVYRDVDCIVQFGHSEIPNIKYTKPVIFIEYYYRTVELDDDVFSVLSEDRIKNIGLLSSVQYYKEMEYVREKLEKLGYNVIIGSVDGRLKYPGQVLGCNFSSAHSIANRVDAYLLVSTGLFHGIGAQLSTDRPVYILDLNQKSIRNIKPEIERFLRKRYARIEPAMDAKKFAIIIDTKIGQYRKKLAYSIYGKVKEMGRDAIIVTADNINPVDIENLMCDAAVFTGCPRVSIDDGEKFRIPILTPIEFEQIFGFKSNDRYIMDEIVGVDSYSPIR